MKRNSEAAEQVEYDDGIIKQTLVRGIYADEFNINDSNESFENIAKFPDNTGSIHDYNNLIENSPD